MSLIDKGKGGLDSSTSASTSGIRESSRDEKKEETNAVPFYKLFTFADSVDKLLMFVGSVGAIGNGLSIPLMTILFGELIDSFGQTVSHNVVTIVSKVSFIHSLQNHTLHLLSIYLSIFDSFILHYLFLSANQINTTN